jgi:dTDP-4-dehydrorhamnose reductase
MTALSCPDILFFSGKEAVMEKLLVVGAESIVGANLACTLADRFGVRALSCDVAVRLAGCDNGFCPRDEAQLAGEILYAAPDWVVYCGALARSSWDELTTAQVSRLAEEPRRISAIFTACQQLGCRLTVIASDSVFTGPRVFHGETGLTHGAGPLAETAMVVEQLLFGTSALVVRTHAYGWGPGNGDINYAEAYWHALDAGRLAHSQAWPPSDSHRHATPILASDLAELLAAAYTAGLQGLYHIAGAERTSPRRFIAELASACDIASWPLRVVSEDIASRPALETSLVCRRARQALGQPMPMLREGLLRFAAQRENGYREGLCGAEDAVPMRASAA